VIKVLAVALVVLGLVALVQGGFAYNQQTTVLDVGGIKATATQHRTLPIAPIAGALALLGGAVLLVMPRMRTVRGTL
jgi:drug/metabolite transporter (DMT)-like permease